jgi:multiple sugar transport system permease protein
MLEVPQPGKLYMATSTKRKGSTSEFRARAGNERRLAVLMILPAVILVAVLMYYPMLRTLQLSLYDTSMLNPTPKFAGIGHYWTVISNPPFGQVLFNSVVWTGVVVFFQAVLGMATAVLLNQNAPGQGILRALILLPWVLPGIVNAVLWRFMYDPQFGLINSILISLGLTTQKTAWLAQGSTALIALIVAAIWKGFPFSTVMYLAALQNVDREQVEAAQIDGASAWQRFRYVTVPAISGIIRLSVLLTTIWTFNYFDLIWVTTKGGPGQSTHIFPTIIYEIGFMQFNFGRASVFGVIAVLLLSVFMILYVRELIRSRNL